MMLTPAERYVLRFAVEYGPRVSFATPTSRREAANRLITRGLLSGSFKACSATDAGRAALATPAGGEEGRDADLR
jgi:hypothetical protein